MIPQIKKILYATDLTKNSTYAFYFAIDLVRKHGAKIVILHCVEPTPPSIYSLWNTEDAVKPISRIKEQEKIRELLQQFCQNIESQIGPPCVDLISEIIVKDGHPVEEILNTADTKECDVIVLGTHGKGWLKHTFLGSVASSALGRARKPVLVVPLPSEKSNAETGRSEVYNSKKHGEVSLESWEGIASLLFRF